MLGDGPSPHTDDKTEMRPVFERKWELDSLCYPIRLSYGYWKATCDRSPFDTGPDGGDAAARGVKTMREQQRRHGPWAVSLSAQHGCAAGDAV